MWASKTENTAWNQQQVQKVKINMQMRDTSKTMQMRMKKTKTKKRISHDDGMGRSARKNVQKGQSKVGIYLVWHFSDFFVTFSKFEIWNS